MDDKLKSIQNTEYEILKAFDSFCRLHRIRYSLYYGTLIGAIRHKGFIPWDDDVDVCMSRKQYLIFIKLWNRQENTNGYILQERHQTKNYHKNFAKLRKEHTTFLEYKEQAGKYHTGLYIDIFPVDYIPANRIKKVMMKALIFIYLLLSKKMEVDPNCKLSRFLEKLISSVSREKAGGCKVLTSYRSSRLALPVTMLDEYIEVPFGDQKFMCLKNYHEVLTLIYGNYMKLPPENERTWVHHPIVISDVYDLDELLERNPGLLDR